MEITLSPLVICSSVTVVSIITCILCNSVSKQAGYDTWQYIASNITGGLSAYCFAGSGLLAVVLGLFTVVDGIRYNCGIETCPEPYTELFVFLYETDNQEDELIGLVDWIEKHPNRSPATKDCYLSLLDVTHQGNRNVIQPLGPKRIQLNPDTLPWNQREE